ncbi:SNF2-related protein [Penicillium sp. DV-2018c]|nr:SNF2-related protein [Penicillium sp. DV-2018c]
MSTEDTDSLTDSRAGTMAPESTVPSSPLTNPTEAEDSKSSIDEDDGSKTKVPDEEEVEEMDSKAKALMHLLKTSSVFVAIMSEKMKKQQEEARLAAMKQREQGAANQKTAKSVAEPARRTTRTRQDQNTAEDKVTGGKENGEEKKPTSNKGRPKRKAAANNGSTISNFFKKADVEVPDQNPSVKQALEQAADDYEANSTALGRQYLEGKALERLESRSSSSTRSQSLKRKRNGSERSTPVKSAKTSGLSTPATSGNKSIRRRRSTRQNYNDLSDDEFDEHLRKLELGIEVEEPKSEPSDDEVEEMERAQNLKLAKKEIGQKKMQNPVLQARLACNSPHNFYWPWTDDSTPIDETLVSASGKYIRRTQLSPRILSTCQELNWFLHLLS